MVTQAIEADISEAASIGSSRAIVRFLDRWIFVIMAGLFVVTALVGFIPSSVVKLGMVNAGIRPPFPAVLHVHAVLMGTWLLLLLAQTTLVATGRRTAHQTLGVAAVAVMPAVVITGIVLVPTMLHVLWSTDVTKLPPPVVTAVAEAKVFTSNLLLFQIRAGVLFPLFVTWALLVRRSDPETHKRLMILATVLPLPAAIDRMSWLPTTMPQSPLASELDVMLWVAPMFLFDVIRQRRVPKAYLIWIAILLPLMFLTNALWGTAWWQATAHRMLGVG